MKMKIPVIIILTVAILLSASSCIVEEIPSDTTVEATRTPPVTSHAETIPDITVRVTDDGTEVPPQTDEPHTAAAHTDAPPQTEAPTEPATEPVTEAPLVVEYKADISAYEKYLDPQGTDEYLILVNPYHPLTDSEYKPSDLTGLVDTRKDRSTRYLREYPAKAFEAFMIEARANGCKDISVTSAFRSYKEQERLFNLYVEEFMDKGMTREEAIVAVRLDTAYPGESEHQTGLALDAHNMSSAKVAFGDTYEGKWMAENCWKFGFILRYLEGKEDITGYVYEPWHFRYVGRSHAKIIHDLGITLEEYLDMINAE